jgi:nucleoside phosphorylase
MHPASMSRGRSGKTKVGLLTVIQEEFDAVKAALGANVWHRRTPYWHGDDGPADFVLARMADRTNVAAFEATRDLFEWWQPEVVLLVGIAGAMEGGDAGLGDVVIPDYIHYGDFRKLTASRDALRYAAYDQPTVSLRTSIVDGVRQEGRWIEGIEASRPAPEGHQDQHGSDPAALKVEVGGIVAGEKVLGDPDHPEQERVFASFESALAVDMESWGVARAVHHERADVGYNPRLCVVRGISDVVKRRQHGDATSNAESPPRPPFVDINNEQRRRWKAYAAATAAAFAATVVRELADDI